MAQRNNDRLQKENADLKAQLTLAKTDKDTSKDKVSRYIRMLYLYYKFNSSKQPIDRCIDESLCHLQYMSPNHDQSFRVSTLSSASCTSSFPVKRLIVHHTDCSAVTYSAKTV